MITQYSERGGLGARGSNPSSIKQANRKIVLRQIQRGGASRATIAERTNLSRGGLTPIINELIQQNLVVECESVEKEVGRPPVPLKLNANYVKVISIQWIRNQLNVAVVGVDGLVQQCWQYAINGNESVDDITQMIIVHTTALLKQEAGNLVLGIIVQAPGPLDAINGVILNPSNFYGWQNVRIVEMLAEHFDLPIRLENNLVGYVVAEQHFGYGKDMKDFIFLVVDDGIGAGFVLNGKLYQGRSHQISEVGHISLDIHGPKCNCGNNGCAEMYASIPAMCRTGLALGKGQPIQDWIQPVHELLQLAIAGDVNCRRALDQEVEYLGNLIVTLINTFDIDTVIIGSMLSIVQGLISQPLHKYVSCRIASKTLPSPHIFFSQLQQPSLVGGALHMFELFIGNQLGSYEELVKRNENPILSEPQANREDE